MRSPLYEHDPLTTEQRGHLTLDEDPVVPIAVYLRTEKRKPSRIAMLWSPADNADVNLVSNKLVRDVLGMHIHQSSEKDSALVLFRGQTVETKGFIDVDWGVEKSRSRSVYQTRFLVTSEVDPPFDFVLGRKFAIAYGLSDR